MKKLRKNKQSILWYDDFLVAIDRQWRALKGLATGELKEFVRELRADAVRPGGDPGPRLYAAGKEVIYRLTGLQLFDSQLQSARAMELGHIVELPTGEGKTLAAVITALVTVFRGEQVQVLVFNDYLARRDFAIAREILAFFDITVGCLTARTDRRDRRELYAKDVLYLSAKEAGFDYLRNFHARQPQELLPLAFGRAIVDEADAVLLDEACLPLVLATTAENRPKRLDFVWQAVQQLTAAQVNWDRQRGAVSLAEAAIPLLERALGVANLYDEENNQLFSLVQAALEARFLLVKDVDYFVKAEQVQLVDQATGRTAQGRKFPELLQQAVAAKEGLTTRTETVIGNSISLQFFLRRYDNLCGMTGTVKTSAPEIAAMYGLPVQVIAPHQPCIRDDHEPQIFLTEPEKEEAVVAQVRRCYEKGQPVLLAAADLKATQRYAELLAAAGIPCQRLDAKNGQGEARLIQEAGRLGQVTVSTNMAGRGVDIRLGGANGQEQEPALAAGGLFVIGTYLNPSRRLDDQLRGRAGRQGDPGESQFFISLDEPLLAQHLAERGLRVTGRETVRQLRHLVKTAQIRQEGREAEHRYALERFGAVTEAHRRRITEFRDQSLVALANAKTGREKARQQLYLHFTVHHFANYLCAMENVRKGIHLVVIGGEDPLTEYKRMAEAVFLEMEQDLAQDVERWLANATITETGLDLEASGLSLPSSTWTYMIDESNSQFSHLPQLMKTMSNSLNGVWFTIPSLWERIKKKKEGEPRGGK